METNRMSKSRNRLVRSVKTELLKKSKEAALAAVQIFNNPNITFKAESYIVLMIIAWTYLLHAHYKGIGTEYRYHKNSARRRVFEKTKSGAYRHCELEKCLDCKNCPLDKDTTNNLKFLIGLRHEIEHQMTTRLDDLLSARFQACCLNYNEYIRKLFGSGHGIEKYLSFSLQFSTIREEQKDMLIDQKNLPGNITAYIASFDKRLTEDEYSSQKFAYRILFVPKTVNKKGQADRVIEFVKSDSPLAQGINKEYALIKEIEKPKYLPAQIVAMMKKEGFKNFQMNNHTELWKKFDAKNPAKGFGSLVADKQWHYYQNWVDKVKRHCQESGDKYK